MRDYLMKQTIALIFVGGSIALVVAGCGGSTAAPSSAPTLIATAVSTSTSEPPSPIAPTHVPTAIPTSAPTAVPTVTPTNVEAVYLDNRSDAAALITSLYNAINQRQYVRAYSYWEDTPQRLDFDQFKAGYQDTTSVQVTLGTIGGGVGAGQLYWSVPVTLMAQTTTGSTQTSVGCYVLHLGQPAAQGVLPFQPMGIQSENIQPVVDKANAADPLAHACDETGQQGPPIPLPSASDPNDISAQQYIDNRSDPVELLRSLFNAINRHEYVRAYSYWESNAQNLPDLPAFTEGYSNTQTVQLTTGTVTSDAGAGQFRYRVPVTLVSALNDGTTQTFVGCYQLHLANPDIQAEPPFQPLGIEAAYVEQVANGSDTPSLMAQACPIP